VKKNQQVLANRTSNLVKLWQ